MARQNSTSLILVDLDNYVNIHTEAAKLYKSVNKIPNLSLLRNIVETLISQISSWIETNIPENNEIYFRFYGGWYDAWQIDSLTERAQMISISTSNIKRRIGKNRIKAELADNILAARHINLTGTLQYRQSKHIIQKKQIMKCSMGDNCRLKIVDDWQENGCPGCGNIHNEIIQKTTQKTIDTSIVADTIYASLSNKYKLIGIVSGDYDLIPGIIYALEYNAKVALFRNKDFLKYDNMIENCTIIHGITY